MESQAELKGMATGKHTLEVGKLTWCYREAEPPARTEAGDDRLPVILLHGLVSQSYSWRDVLPALANDGFHTFAPDWIGCGFSAMPDQKVFDYKPDTLIQALSDWIDTLELQRFHLVAQGFLGSMGIQYALRHPERVDRLAIFNAPLTQSAKLPWKLQQIGWPLIGEALAQDPLLVDRTLEGGGGYRVEDEDMDVYRRPWIKTSDAGFALLAMIRNLQLQAVTAEIELGLQEWTHPLLIGWGVRDPWLPAQAAETFAQSLKDANFVALEEVGHYVQEDWHEKVSETLLWFLKKLA
jgi:pimeloyl-ACP methyl ester carboxylesterase